MTSLPQSTTSAERRGTSGVWAQHKWSRHNQLTWVALASCTVAYQVQAELHYALSFLWQMSS